MHNVIENILTFYKKLYCFFLFCHCVSSAVIYLGENERIYIPKISSIDFKYHKVAKLSDNKKINAAWQSYCISLVNHSLILLKHNFSIFCLLKWPIFSLQHSLQGILAKEVKQTEENYKLPPPYITHHQPL